jgi:type VI secretion system (T6SS) baseplate-like injector VgrG
MYPEQRDTTLEVAKYYGKYAGIVLDHSTVPADAAKRGQIMVRVPGILEEGPSGADQPIEVLARPSFLSGFFFIPEEGAQVWAEFVAGDINFPIWTGVWYPDQVAPKTVDGSEPTRFQKVIRTMSGQVVQLDDTNGSEQTVITDSKNGNTVTFDANGILLEDSNGNSVKLDSNGITLKDLNSNQLILDSSGITLQSAAAGKLVVASTSVKMTDGAGSLQLVVLEPLLSQWLNSHQHVGNMGAPTPLLPPLIPLLSTIPTFKSGAA